MNRELANRERKNKRTQKLGDAVSDYLQKNGMNDRFLESFLQHEWKNIVGILISKYTSSVILKGNKVILKIESAPLRNELLMNKSQLIQNINQHLNTNRIQEIVFV
jgi:predicted nucleic acid-binding Zn ribbon protein